MVNFKDGLRSDSAKRQYPVRLKYFFDSLYTKDDQKFVPLNEISIEEQVKEFMKHKDDPKYIEQCFRKMIRVQTKRVEDRKIETSTIINYYKAAKLFCDMNDINTGWKKVTKILPKYRRYALDRIPTEDEIKKLCEYPDRRIKGIVYTILSCVMRLEAWNYLRWKDIVPQYDENGKLLAAKIIIYDGDPEQYFSFITPEAYNYLDKFREYRIEHGEKLDSNSGLCVIYLNQQYIMAII